MLQAGSLGTITRGSPVYYHDLQVGVVGSTALDSDDRQFRIDVFINAPFNDLVRSGTRFWDASAVQVSMINGGPRLQFQSVPALFQGAVDFETASGPQGGAPARPNAVFPLYESEAAAQHAPAAGSVPYRVVFHAEEAGALDAGAPVTLDQKRIGSVTESTLQYDPRSGQLQDLVTLAIEPDDIVLAGAGWAADARPQMDAMLERLIGEGLRARLGSTIPVVGGKAVELAFVPKAPQASLGAGPIPEIPTGPESERVHHHGIAECRGDQAQCDTAGPDRGRRPSGHAAAGGAQQVAAGHGHAATPRRVGGQYRSGDAASA